MAVLAVYLTSLGKGIWTGRCVRRLTHFNGDRERVLVAVLAVYLTSLGIGGENWSRCSPSASPHWGNGKRAGRCARRLLRLSGERERELVAVLAICLTSLGIGRESWSLCSPFSSPHWGKGERAGRSADRLPHLTGEMERELVAVLAVCFASMGKGRESWSLCSPFASLHWG